ncbi:MAG: hypothetical protein A2057_04665 [Ignavibacteria bacterium GWA2_35_9]|nr:MAG: hypothetical protein A2057_04665 [Ignavibacteria bacterium GWA2_35_9]OGU45601.1 MAG: hypothetical protein A2000_12970 [Ignavibacteria bacterium GWB2_36_8]OGU49260.1 MAG: hypothetical protein A2080_10245 [Ignavibacteria bacterium GWC2_36_12]
MLYKISAVLFLLSIYVYPQKIVEAYQPPEGYLRIGPEPERMIPMVEKGFTLILPEGEVNGVVVVPCSKRIDVKENINKKGSLEGEAIKKNFAVVRILTGNPLDFYFNNDVMKDVAKRLQSVLIENDIRGKPIYFTGLSLEGTRCLKLAIFLQRNKEKYWVQPSAVAIVDAPLDMVRFWDAENRVMINNFYPDAAEEGKWVTYLLKENLGTPEENFNNYVDYSPFVYKAVDGGNAKYLRNVPVRAYHEPDVNWWIENRRKDYYSMNSIDLAALINQLKLLHNDQSELITTYQKREGSSEGSSPHTDSIVDYAELMVWFLSHNN